MILLYYQFCNDCYLFIFSCFQNISKYTDHPTESTSKGMSFCLHSSWFGLTICHLINFPLILKMLSFAWNFMFSPVEPSLPHSLSSSFLHRPPHRCPHHRPLDYYFLFSVLLSWLLWSRWCDLWLPMISFWPSFSQQEYWHTVTNVTHVIPHWQRRFIRQLCQQW